MSEDETQDAAFSLMVASGAATVVMASALLYVMTKTGSSKRSEPTRKAEEEVPVELDRQKYPGGHLSIYFASQTGTAESFANQLEREGAEHGFFVHVIDLEDVEVEEVLNETRRDEGGSKAIFLCSTYGEGEPTDNAVEFVTEVKSLIGDVIEEKKDESSPSGEVLLSGLDYCVFGLGNRQYEHYNEMGKFFDASLEKIGARRIAPIGLGDDDDDLEGDFETWKDSVLWPTLKAHYVKEAIISTTKAVAELPETPYAVEYVDPSKPEKIELENVQSSSRHYFSSVDCPVQVVKELRSKDAAGSTVHVEVDLSKTKGFNYRTADNLGVLPENDATVVAAVADALDYDLDAHFVVKPNPKHEWHGAPFPSPITVRECLSRYCDLTGSPRRSDLKLLASYARDPIDKKALLRMSSKEGRAEYKEKIVQSHVGLVELLKLCPSIQAPLEHFLNFCPRMVPRYYTISSSSSVHPQTIHLTVAVTETIKKDGSVYKGLCSSYLADSSNRTLRIFDRESGFRLPSDTTKPIVMIGPGTGIAPMRALIQEREYQRKRQKLDVGANVLYFGCQNRKKDYIYEDELAAHLKSGELSELHVAFSREQAGKVYVQHLLSKRAKETWSLVEEQGAFIYVCGGVKMGHDVQEALTNIIAAEGGRSAQEAKSYLDQLAKDGRYVQELWT